MVREIVRAEQAHVARRADERARRLGYPSARSHESGGGGRVRVSTAAVVRRVRERYCERPVVRARSVRGRACKALHAVA